MNLETYESLSFCKDALTERGIKHEVNPGSIFIREEFLDHSNLFIALLEVKDPQIRDSLRNMLMTDMEFKPGIEYITQIDIGHMEDADFLKWKDLLYPSEFSNGDICQVNDSLRIHFTRGNINEIKGITFLVQSLDQARLFFIKNDLQVISTGNGFRLSPEQTFGLTLYFSEKE